MTIVNKHFDTHFPIHISEVSPEGEADSTAAENFYLPYLAEFRHTHLLGDILEDLNNVTGQAPCTSSEVVDVGKDSAPSVAVGGMTAEKARVHDERLQKWRDSWPRDLELTEYAIATALARTQEEGVQRRGLQSLHMLGKVARTLYLLQPLISNNSFTHRSLPLHPLRHSSAPELSQHPRNPCERRVWPCRDGLSLRSRIFTQSSPNS